VCEGISALLPNYMVIAVAALFLVFLYNWATTFRAID
jgi:hypothetical protein